MTAHHTNITVPELGLPDTPISVSVWHVAVGSEVYQGDRVVELLAGSATIDVAAPASGRLVRRMVQEDEVVAVEQIVGVIEVDHP